MELCKISGSAAFQFGHLPKRSVFRMTGTEFKPQNRMFIARMGFVGQLLGREVKNHGWDVSGTCTSINTKKKLEEERTFEIYLLMQMSQICLIWETNIWILFSVIILDAIKNHTHMVVSSPSVPGIGDPMLHYEQILRRELVGGNLQCLGYLSSTSVYGDTGGVWVDEDYIPNPTSESGRLRLAAGEGWFNSGQSLGISTQVFCLGGIYGHGRSAVDTIVKQGALSESQRMRGHRQFTSRVAVDDICQAIMASICTPSSRVVREKLKNVLENKDNNCGSMFVALHSNSFTVG